jgi:drug/metabolite transporter (DMT)-like permease
MPATSIGFWRVLIGTVALAIWGMLFRRDLFRADRRGWLLVGLGGGAMVALFEIAYQFASPASASRARPRCSIPRPSWSRCWRA